jgi:chorismate dehydratase
MIGGAGRYYCHCQSDPSIHNLLRVAVIIVIFAGRMLQAVLINWGLPSQDRQSPLRVCAVSYLNTVPLVWGMLDGAQRGMFDLLFRVPSECADLVASGAADIGIIPSFELMGGDLATVPGVGICSRGAVRSIVLISKRPAAQIRTLAADVSSRTSVALARIILSRKYGAEAVVVERPPDLARMLEEADSALIIGDPALRLDIALLPYHVYDLGWEWLEMTGLPMVFAVWAGPPASITPPVAAAFQESCAWGLANLERIVAEEAAGRCFDPELVRRYLTTHIVYRLGEAEEKGMELFLRYASQLPARAAAGMIR